MSNNTRDQIYCLQEDQPVGCWWTFNPRTKFCNNVHHPNTPPAPDPVKIDWNISPLGVETTSTPVSKFAFHLFLDAVDQDPSVKILSAMVDQNECRQVVQGQVVLAAIERRNALMEL
jgi:hypothetical protein